MNIYDSIICRLEARARTPADRLDAGRLRQELARLRTQITGLENEVHQLHLEIQDGRENIQPGDKTRPSEVGRGERAIHTK